ncbi:MAG: non-canonical purine NTP pyrophosphatase [Planctomycetota bacterium]
MTKTRPDRIVIATGNAHKVGELAAILADAAPGVRFVGLAELDGTFEEPVEDGGTFEANATIKARSYAAQTGAWCLADDSGIEIDALGGRPGVISSHYFCDGVPNEEQRRLPRAERDRLNNERVLTELKGVEDRAARFVCTILLADPEGNIRAESRGTFEGRIGEPPRVPAGANGFGYDPLFLTEQSGYSKTGAELDPEAKNRLSHRAAAGRGLVETMRQLW